MKHQPPYRYDHVGSFLRPTALRTARDNAWAATLEDRARHEERAALTREVAALVARRADHRRLADAR